MMMSMSRKFRENASGRDDDDDLQPLAQRMYLLLPIINRTKNDRFGIMK